MTADGPSGNGSGLPPMDHAGRRDRLRAQLGEHHDVAADRMLVTRPENVRYLSGFRGSNGQLLIGGAGADDLLITDGRYEARAATEAPDLAVELSRDAAAVALSAAEGGTLAVESTHLSWSAADDLRRRASDADVEVVAADDVVERLRAVKDEAELTRIHEACRLTVAALGWLFDEVVAVGRTERGLAVALERRFIDTGADGVAFPSIVASGPNAAAPHHEPTHRRLEAGDVVTIDCGAVVDGYHADLTRTVAIGHLDDRLREVHDLVRAAQRAGRDAAVAGASAGDVDEAARSTIVAAGHGDRFVHGTGHGVGLDIHEAPAVAQGSPATLEAGMALTVEPGVYLPGLGGVRIEDTIVVTADGAPHTLTDIPHELRVLSTT